MSDGTCPSCRKVTFVKLYAKSNESDSVQKQTKATKHEALQTYLFHGLEILKPTTVTGEERHDKQYDSTDNEYDEYSVFLSSGKQPVVGLQITAFVRREPFDDDMLRQWLKTEEENFAYSRRGMQNVFSEYCKVGGFPAFRYSCIRPSDLYSFSSWFVATLAVQYHFVIQSYECCSSKYTAQQQRIHDENRRTAEAMFRSVIISGIPVDLDGLKESETTSVRSTYKTIPLACPLCDKEFTMSIATDLEWLSQSWLCKQCDQRISVINLWDSDEVELIMETMPTGVAAPSPKRFSVSQAAPGAKQLSNHKSGFREADLKEQIIIVLLAVVVLCVFGFIIVWFIALL